MDSRSPKILTVGAVIDLIALTKIPPGELSADNAILDRIEAYRKLGCILTPDAELEVAKHRNNVNGEVLFSDAAE